MIARPPHEWSGAHAARVAPVAAAVWSAALVLLLLGRRRARSTRWVTTWSDGTVELVEERS